MKKSLSLLSALLLALALTACGGASVPAESEPEPVELHVFAAASLQESLDAAIAAYPYFGVTIIPTYDSSGLLKTQIEEGAVCDIFISAAPKQMNALDATQDAEKNPDGLDFVDSETRRDLLENKVTLAVPEGNPAGIQSFDQLAELLQSGDVMLAMGNSDVPVGQYTQKIFAYYGIDETAISSCLTYGSNVKEVTTQVSEGTVDCGIIYGTDAFSAGLTVVDEATAEMCGQVIYPAAVLKDSGHPEIALGFLEYLSTNEAKACFEAVGFSPLT